MQDAVALRRPHILPYEIHVDQRRFANTCGADVSREIRRLERETPPFLLHLWDENNDYFEHDEYLDAWGIHWTDGYPSPENRLSVGDDPQFPEAAGSPWVQRVERLVADRGDSYLLGHVWFTLFERLHLLYGFENALVMPYLNPERFVFLRDRIVEHCLAKIELFLQLGVDGVFFSDDWGTQAGLLISRGDWRRYFAPAYVRLFGPLLKEHKAIWFHSCGNIMELIPDLLGLGVGVLNPVQSSVLDVSELARRFGGQLCFFGGLDTQRFLPRSDPAAVARQVRELATTLGGRGGGYIGGTSHTILPDVPIENIRAAYRAFAEISGLS